MIGFLTSQTNITHARLYLNSCGMVVNEDGENGYTISLIKR